MERELADFVPPRGKGAARSTRAWLIAHALAWGFWLVVLNVVGRRFEAIFADFGVDLSGITVLFVKLAHMGAALALLCLILLGVDWAVLRTLDRRGEAGRYRAWAVAMLVVPLLLFGATIVGFVLPLTTLETRLSG
jgi:hypothetical protein